ncbi:PucR family transcriptional regulator [Mycobacterium sp. 852013-51886_SCH5428379]|uniref:PucR family transcriptional regulator n=1 Tax=Mycobacterium sp. 852013-51886_SCH5428379 TaxID=1834111 RepID=UPI0007FF7171|nr:PucR family transcriptional regulator [Mycobacterium sp. 852013-51886_SCH5428379]OBB59795.1 PucR family transcriptional regulator [Mycobacterium sp. 852013-51886_SCH5428379]
MVTLDRLINVLGGYGVQLRACSVPRSTALRSVVMHEQTDERVVTGDVLLAIGAESMEDAVAWARAARAAVVLVVGQVEHDGTGGPVQDLTMDAAAPAVMVVDPGISWSELAAIVYGLVLEGRETESGRGPTDLFALADSLGDAIGAAVTIEDPHWEVLAYSRLQQGADGARAQTILARRAPDRLRALFVELGVHKHLAESDDPLFIPPAPEHELSGRMVVAARAGRQLLGSVWVACPETLPDPQLRALSDGARMVALHLLRSRASADLERQVESELVIGLLDGTADASTVASKLALPAADLRVIALRASVGEQRHAALLQVFERATAGFGWSRPGRSALAGATVYTVLPTASVEIARHWVADLRASLPDRMSVRAGISAPATVLEIPAARDEADECLALHELRPAAADAVAYDESWDDILLQRLRVAARAGRAPQRGPIADLRRHDAGHATRYVDTLRAWLAAQGDLHQAGELLGVHENTVRYRMRRMAEVTTLDLDDVRKRLAMTVELAATDDLSPPDSPA